jgi:short-subunit dehydrogenase
MRKTALITGASSGIGYELGKIFAKNDFDLVLVSRNEEKLENIAGELKKKHDIQVRVIAKDLSKPSSPKELYDQVTGEGTRIDVLVNNAGVAAYGKFTDSRADRNMDLIQLNIAAPTILCKLFGADMAREGSGRILNVSSTAAFQAGPLLSTYYASKGYLLLLSEALSHEFKQDGVTVTALCPGPVKTEFFKRNDMTDTKLNDSPFMMNAARVAEIGFSGLMKGKPLVIPGAINKLLVFLERLAPRRVASSVAYLLNKSRKRG